MGYCYPLRCVRMAKSAINTVLMPHVNTGLPLLQRTILARCYNPRFTIASSIQERVVQASSLHPVQTQRGEPCCAYVLRGKTMFNYYVRVDYTTSNGHWYSFSSDIILVSV